MNFYFLRDFSNSGFKIKWKLFFLGFQQQKLKKLLNFLTKNVARRYSIKSNNEKYNSRPTQLLMTVCQAKFDRGVLLLFYLITTKLKNIIRWPFKKSKYSFN